MTTSTGGFDPNIPHQLFDMLEASIASGTKMAANIMWSSLLSYLAAHWIATILTLFVVFVFVFVKAKLGRWGSLGSFLYNFFYFGTLFIIGLIWGPEVFLGDWFKVACTALLYPICYFLSGYLMEKMGVFHNYH
jgi:hypothetical protein